MYVMYIMYVVDTIKNGCHLTLLLLLTSRYLFWSSTCHTIHNCCNFSFSAQGHWSSMKQCSVWTMSTGLHSTTERW